MAENDRVATEKRGFWRQVLGWCYPWRQVARYPGPLLHWFAIAVGMGSAGVWLTPVAALDTWLSSLSAGSLGTFCIVLLSQSIATSTGRVDPELGEAVAENGRRFAVALALIFVLVQAGVIVRFKTADAPSSELIVAQVVLVLLTLATSVYVLCFKLSALEPGAEVVSAQEDEDIRELLEGAQRTSTSKAGDAL